MKTERELLPVELLLTEDERRTEPDTGPAGELDELLRELRDADPLRIDIKPERLRRR